MALNAVAAARNVPLLEPEGICSKAGTVRLVEFEVRLTVPPPDPLRTTVHVLEALGAKVPGPHAMEVIAVTVTGVTLTMPPVPVIEIALPEEEAAVLLLMAMGTEVLAEGVTDKVATTPPKITLEFNPHVMHVYEPIPALQVRNLPADVNAGPGVTFKLPMLAAR